MANDIWMFIIIVIVAIILPILIIGITNIGPSFFSDLGNVLIESFVGLLFLLLFGGVLIFGIILGYSHPKTGKIMAYIGIAGVLLSLTFVEFFVAFSTGKNRFKENFTIKECKNLPIDFQDIKSIPDTFSCIITGYLPQNSSSFYLIGFWVFGFVIPILLTSNIFLDLVESSGILTNKMSKKIIGWSLGFLAYRGLLITNLIYVIDYASAGMAIIVLNFIFIGGLLAYTNKMFSQWKSIEDSIEFGKSIQIAKTNAHRILDQAIKSINNGTDIDQVYSNLLSPFEMDFETASKKGWLSIQSARTKYRNDSRRLANELKKIMNNYYKL